MIRSAITRRELRPRDFTQSLDNWTASRWPWLLVAVIVVAASARIFAAVLGNGDVGRAFIAPDSFEYDHLGVNLATGNGFSEVSTAPFVPDIARTPVYPLVLAALYAVGGHRPVLGVALGVVFGVLACVLAAQLGRDAYGGAVGIVAGFLLAIDEVSAVYSIMLMTETLFTVFILLAALDQGRYLREGRMVRAVSSAIWTGLAILTRPIGLFLPLLSGPVLAGIGPNRTRQLRVVLTASVVIVGMAFPTVWTLRNYLVSGLAQPTSLIAINGYYYRAVPLEGASPDPNLPRLAALPGSSTGDENAHVLMAMENRSLQLVLANPLGYARIHASGILRMLGPDRDALGQLTKGVPPTAVSATTVSSFIAETVHNHRPETSGIILDLESAQLVFLYALAIVGTWAGIRQLGRTRHTILFWSLIGYFLAISGPEAYPRFRVPIMPFISILAALGVRTVWRRFRTVVRSRSFGSGPVLSPNARVRP